MGDRRKLYEVNGAGGRVSHWKSDFVPLIKGPDPTY